MPNETTIQTVFRGAGHWAMPPPLWPEHKIFLNTLNQKKNLWGGGTAPSPDPFFSGEGTPHRRLRRVELRVFGSAPPSQNPKYATDTIHLL